MIVRRKIYGNYILRKKYTTLTFAPYLLLFTSDRDTDILVLSQTLHV